MTTETRQDLRDQRDILKEEIEEFDAELIGIREEIREAKERLTWAIAQRKMTRISLGMVRAELKAK